MSQSITEHGSIETVSLDDEDFRRISTFMRERCGIEIPSGKQMLVRSRLGPRVAELGLRSMGDYLTLAHRDGNELSRLIDLLTTNKTGFFRESQHFEYLAREVYPQIDRGRSFSIWSAGCSTGEEPYSLAMSWCEQLPRNLPPPAILATDISTRALACAREGRYARSSLTEVAPERIGRHFEPDPQSPSEILVRSAVRAPVRFARLNLIQPWPMRGPFDLILCRNVMIYFSRQTQLALVARFAELLRPGGHLFIGHAESAHGSQAPLQFIQPAVYRRLPDADAALGTEK